MLMSKTETVTGTHPVASRHVTVGGGFPPSPLYLAPMLRRRDGVPSGRAQPRLGAAWLRQTPARIGLLVVLLLAVSVVRYIANQPSLAISLYALIPIVLSVYWFELAGGLLTAVAATLLFLADELAAPSTELDGGTLWVAAGNRGFVFLGIAALVALMLRRERALSHQVREQQSQLSELEAIRSVLTPTAVPPRPHLDIATSFIPADGLVAGDFFLVVEGPSDSTTVIVGDVVGHGLAAARGAAFVRAALATFARFTSDPVQLLQLANAALAEHELEDAGFVTAVCLNIGQPPNGELLWAAAGHDVPWFLDTAEPLPGGRVGAPLGTGADALKIEAGRTLLVRGAGVLVFTDGLTEARTRREPGRPLELFGEERAMALVRDRAGAPVGDVLDALSSAVTAFTGGPLADDICLVAFRAREA